MYLKKKQTNSKPAEYLACVKGAINDDVFPFLPGESLKGEGESWIVMIAFCWARQEHQSLKPCKGPAVQEGRAGDVGGVGRPVGCSPWPCCGGQALSKAVSAWLVLGKHKKSILAPKETVAAQARADTPPETQYKMQDQLCPGQAEKGPGPPEAS